MKTEKAIRAPKKCKKPSARGTDVIVYRGKASIDVVTDGETVWLSIDQMAKLFGRDKSVIGKHVRNVFKEGELAKRSVWANFAYTAADGKTYQVDYYNLDVIISVGYRVKSPEGVRFRQWATKCLREILLGKLRRELANAETARRVDAVEHRLTQVENGLELISQRLEEDPEPFLSKDRKMIGFRID